MNAVAAGMGAMRRQPRTLAPPAWATLPWIGFVLITAVFWITTHDLRRSDYINQRSVEQFNPTLEEAMSMLQTYEGGTLIKAAAYLALAGWGVLTAFFILGLRRFQIYGLMAHAALAFFLFVCLSYLWADRPEITLNKIAIFVCLVLGGFGLALRFKPSDVLLFVVLSSLGYLLVGVAAEVALGTFRPWVAGYRFSGTIHPNGQGLNCALLVLAAGLAAMRFPSWRRVLWAIAIFAFAMLILTKSRTPLGTLFIVLFAYWIATRPVPVKLMLSLIAGGALCTIVIFGPTLFPLLARVINLGRTDLQAAPSGMGIQGMPEGSSGQTLTGRTELWEECWKFVEEKPLLGYGYNSFWTVDNNLEIGARTDWLSGSAHSIYFDLLLGVGFIGLCLYLILVAFGLWRSFSYYRETGRTELAYSFMWMLLLFSLIHGIAESTFLFPAMHTFLVMGVLIQLGYAPRPSAQETPGAANASGAPVAQLRTARS